jgi:S-adenosylmethionine decarboxylase
MGVVSMPHLLVGEVAVMATMDLFQLGMDTADTTPTLASQTEDRKDYFIERDGVRFAGTHLIIDLFGAKRLDEIAHVEAALRHCITVAGATLLHIHLHHFTPNGGVSGVAVLAESHISVHTWPEAGYAAFDVFMCGHAQPHLAVAVLEEAFTAEGVRVVEHKRGEEMSAEDWQSQRPQLAA